MKQKSSPQQAIDRLAQWWRDTSAAKCRLGKEPPPRRGGGCSSCTAAREFEIEQAIAQLINSGAFTRPGLCPYRVVASHLIAGLWLGPEASRDRSARRHRVDPVVEVKGALRCLRSILHAGPNRDDVEAMAIGNAGHRWQALYAVLTAERALKEALRLFATVAPESTPYVPRGRIGALHKQAVARTMALAWRQLTGRLPAKDNSKFHNLLMAAIATVFGHAADEPNLESATRTAVEHIRKDAGSRS